MVQLYISAPQTEIEKPIRELKSFAKTKELKPGESQIVSFNIDGNSLASFWSGISSWVVDKGEYEVQIGASSTDIKLREKFNVENKIIIEKVHDALYPNFILKELSQKSE